MAVITYDRRSGNSTRLLDDYVQELFTMRVVKIVDHYVPNRKGDSNHEASKDLFYRFMRRINIEHPSDMPKLEINKDKLTIKFKQEYDGII